MQKINMLLIGGWEKNAGKTTLTTRLIKELKSTGFDKIICAKVTVLRDFDGKKEPEIWEEYNPDREKDTGRMLKAGAHKVFWLKTDEEHVEQGLTELLSRVPDDAFLICESNILRKYAEPLLFIMVKRDNPLGMKKSAEKVKNYVDLMVTSALTQEGLKYDPDAGEISGKISDIWQRRNL